MPEPSQKSDSVVARMIGALILSYFVIGPLFALANPNSDFRRLGVVGILACLPFVAFGCVGVWICLFRRIPTPGEGDLESDPERPSYSPDSLICQFQGVREGTHSVVVDHDAEMVHFQKCHAPRGFLTTAQPWVSCSFEDILAVHPFRGLTIVTKSGKAFVPNVAKNYRELFHCLAEVCPENRGAPATDDPLMGYAYLGGAIFGSIASWFLGPQRASDSTLALCVLFGACLGIVAVHWIVWLADRYLGISLSLPFGLGTLGLKFGVLLGVFIATGVNWNPWIIFLPTIIGAVSGFIIGVFVLVWKSTHAKS